MKVMTTLRAPGTPRSSCIASQLLLLFLLLSQQAAAQRKTSGQVLDAATRQALPGASVTMWQVNFPNQTAEDGSFTLYFPNSGNMKYYVAHPGYQTATVRPETGEHRVILLVKKSENTQADPLPSSPEIPGFAAFTPARLSADSLHLHGLLHPAQLLQGQVAGLHVARPGGNPNEEFSLRLRGLSTFTAQTAPLIVVDGLPESSLYLLDPADIASVRVLKDAASASEYGIRGASGVILVETKGVQKGGLQVRYNGFVSQDLVGRRMPTATADEFAEVKGLDFGESNDWQSQITRTPFSTTQHLSLSGGGNKAFGYVAAMGYRNARGILRHSGFEQLNGRLQLRLAPWKERVVIQTQLFASGRESDYSFPEAFRYAVSFNPTAPARTSDPAFDSFDGWFETKVFDGANPVALLEQNKNLGKWQQHGGKASLMATLSKHLKISASYIHQQSYRAGGRYISPRSIYEVGYFLQGSLRQYTDERTNQYGELLLSGDFQPGGGLDINYRAGYQRQRHAYASTSMLADSTGTLELDFDNLDDNIAGVKDIPGLRGARNVQAFFTHWKAGWRQFSLEFNLRREGSNILEGTFRQGLFYGAKAGVSLDKWLKADNYRLSLRLSHGRTGGLFNRLNPHIAGYPYYLDLSQAFQAGGEYLPGLNFFGNPGFRFEKKQEWNLGADFAVRFLGLQGSLDFYKNTASDLMLVEPFYIGNLLFGYTPYNVGKLKNSGFELSLSADVIKKTGFSWRTRLNCFTAVTEVARFSRTGQREERWLYGDFVAASGIPARLLLEEGRPLGQFFGAVFERVDANGIPVLKNLDDDGVTDPYTDAKVIGSAIPRLSFGWQHHLALGRLDLVLNWRGALGHGLANDYRQSREHVGFTSLNFIATKYFIPGQVGSGGFSDRYLERASFLKLDYGELGYRLPWKNGACRLYVSARQLLTLSSYQGSDPEPRLEQPGQPLSPGMDGGNTYYRSVGFVAGASLEL